MYGSGDVPEVKQFAQGKILRQRNVKKHGRSLELVP